MDNRNLSEEQILALGEAMDLIDTACGLLKTNRLREADLKMNEARNKVNSVRAGGRPEIGLP